MPRLRAPVGDRPAGPTDVRWRLTRRYDATNRNVNTAAASIEKGNSGIPPPLVLVVVLLELEEVIVTVGVTVEVVELVEVVEVVELDVVVLV